MREILFRGKAANRIEGRAYRTSYKNGDWVYGLLTDVLNYRGFAEMTNTAGVSGIEVDPETVGQFTGLTDKNGKEIFEGDIVKQTFEKTVAIATADFWGGDEYADLYGKDVGVVVILPSKGTCIKNPVIYREVNGEITEDGEVAKMYKNICSGRCEVIGTIHDNPELVEVSK